MGRYLQPEDLYRRYNTTSGINPADINSHYIYYAEAKVDATFGPYLTVPFSDNNITVKDLTLEWTYILCGNLKVEDRQEKEKAWMEWAKRIINGQEQMIVTSGDAINATQGAIHNTTQGYHPTFGILDVEDSLVDSSQQYSEWLERHY